LGLGLRLGTAALAACASACAFDKSVLCAKVPSPPVAAAYSVEVRFVGVGGFYIRRGSQAILTAPLFSSPSWLSVGVGQIATKPEKAPSWLRKVGLAETDLRGVTSILAGHGHYDHLLDVPSVYPLVAPDAEVFTNLSAKRTLAGYETGPSETHVPNDKVIPLDDQAVAYDGDPAGRWQWLVDEKDPAGGIRMLALKSEHAAQFELFGERLSFWEGERVAAAASPPRKAAEWPQGQVLAFLIDFLDPVAPHPVVFRIHYADSASCAPCGLVPHRLHDDRPVDLLILNAGGSESMAGYPKEMIENTCAKHVLLGHWENFFEEYEKPEKLAKVPGIDRFLKRVQESPPDACLPAPGWSFSYPIGPASGTCAWTAPAAAKQRACGCRVGPDGKCGFANP